MHNALQPILIAVCPIKGQRRTPVLPHDDDSIAQIELSVKCIKILPVLNEAIAVRATGGELIRVANADQIGRDTTKMASISWYITLSVLYQSAFAPIHTVRPARNTF